MTTTTTIDLPKHALQAALICAGDKDRRPYLNSVMLRGASDGQLYIVGLDGYRAFVGRIKGLIEPGATPFGIIIPRGVVSAAIKLAGARGKTLRLVLDAPQSLHGIQFTAISGPYPDLNRVIPDSVSGERAHYNWSFVAEAHKALAVWAGFNASVTSVPLQMDGPRPAVMAIDGAFCLVAPIKTTDAVFFFRLSNLRSRP